MSPTIPPFAQDKTFAVVLEENPVSGDAIARALDDPRCPFERATRRFPLGDLLWPAVRGEN